MMRYLLGANFCICVLRDRPKGLRETFNDNAEVLCILGGVLYALLYGAERSENPVKTRREVERFAARLSVLPFDKSECPVIEGRGRKRSACQT